MGGSTTTKRPLNDAARLVQFSLLQNGHFQIKYTHDALLPIAFEFNSEKHYPCRITLLGDTQQVGALLIAVTLLSSHCVANFVIFLPIENNKAPKEAFLFHC